MHQLFLNDATRKNELASLEVRFELQILISCSQCLEVFVNFTWSFKPLDVNEPINPSDNRLCASGLFY